MATNEVHVGDIGTEVKMTLADSGVAVDISNASDQRFLVLAPDGTTTTWVAVFDTDGTDGTIKYTTEDGDLDQAGVWYVQAQIEWSSGVLVTAARQSMLVHPIIA